jgi:two-component system phosphate regulon sensor histidine kinase PhoR
MKQREFNLSRYKFLTIITVLILVCIVAMQGFWLYTAYIHERDRFRTDINNAMTTTVTQLQLQRLVSNGSPALKTIFKDAIIDKNTTIIKIPSDTILLDAKNGNIPTGDSLPEEVKEQLEKLKTVLSEMSNDTTLNELAKTISKKELNQYRATYQKSIQNAGIHLPFELAILDSNKRSTYISCDSIRFWQIEYRTSGDDDHKINFQNETIIAAFPTAPSYILKQISSLLLASVLLITLGCISFSYLIFLFFRQRRISELRNHFMNNMTHELKTPISAVAVALELLLDESKTYPESKKKTLLTIAQKEIMRLTDLVETVLNISSSDKKGFQLYPAAIPANEIMEALKANSLPLIEKQNGVIHSRITPHSLTVYADRVHLMTILQNLVENAFKYRSAKDPVISIDMQDLKHGVSIKITDNGIGVPSVYLEKIFDKFFRVPDGDVHNVKGYGLGLSYVKSLVELHGGTIKAESVLGEGSTFIVYLPAK